MRPLFEMPKIVRFLFVGGLNTLVGFLVFSMAIYLSNGNIGLSLAANIGVGVFFNYLSYGLGVFRSFGKRQFAKFVLAYAFLYLLNYAALQLMQGYQMNIYLAQFINVFYLAPLSYLIFNKLVFVQPADLEAPT
jgi:putative flippase GtrA